MVEAFTKAIYLIYVKIVEKNIYKLNQRVRYYNTEMLEHLTALTFYVNKNVA